MNIAFLYLHAPDESMGSIYRIKNLCQGLNSTTHKVYIFSPYRYSQNWGPNVEFVTISSISRGGKISSFIYSVIRKILNSRFLAKYTILNPRFLQLTVKRIAKGISEAMKTQGLKLDVFIGESELAGLILLNQKNNLECKIITDFQNFWPEELVEHNIIKRKSKRYKFLMDLEEKILKESDKIITPSVALKEFLTQNFKIIEEKKIIPVINGGEPLVENPTKKEFPPKIINSGMVVHRSNLELFLKSIPYILKEYPETEIYITRKGEELKRIMKLAEDMDLAINFYWKDTFDEYIKLLKKCHIGVVTSSEELTRSLGFVTKIYDYFALGIPVVGNDIGGWTSIIEEAKLGLLSKSEPEDLANKILELLKNPDLMYEYGKNGIKLLNTEYNIENSGQNLLKVVQETLEN